MFSLILLANDGDGVKAVGGKKNVAPIKITDEELKQILQYNNEVILAEGFLDRTVKHCKAVSQSDAESFQLLKKMIETFPPQYALASVTPGTAHETVLRSILNKEDGPAIDLPEVCSTHDTPYFTLNVQGKEIKIVRKSDGKEMTTKTCKDASHVKNTVAKWMKEPETLSTFIANS